MKVFDEEDELFSLFDQFVMEGDSSFPLGKFAAPDDETSEHFQDREIELMMRMIAAEVDNDSDSFNRNESSENSSIAGYKAIKVEGVEKKKWKSSRKPSLKPQKIFRTDIRRKYPSMYMNVMNSLDPEMMNGFFSKFCSPHFTYERRRDEMSGVGQMSATIAPRPIYGLARFIRTIVTFFTPTILADLVVHVRDPKIIVTKGVPGSRIVMEDTSELTLLYSLKRVSAQEYAATNRQSSQPLPAPGFEVVDPTTNDRIVFSLLPKPIRVRFTAEVVFIMDESNVINAISVTQKP